MEAKRTGYALVLQRWQLRDGMQHQTIPFLKFFSPRCSIPKPFFFSLCLSLSYLSLARGGGKGEKTGELSLRTARQAGSRGR